MQIDRGLENKFVEKDEKFMMYSGVESNMHGFCAKMTFFALRRIHGSAYIKLGLSIRMVRAWLAKVCVSP